MPKLQSDGARFLRALTPIIRSISLTHPFQSNASLESWRLTFFGNTAGGSRRSINAKDRAGKRKFPADPCAAEQSFEFPGSVPTIALLPSRG